MKAFYTDHFVLPLPEGHRFPMRKYALLRERVSASGLFRPEDLLRARRRHRRPAPAGAHGRLPGAAGSRATHRARGAANWLPLVGAMVERSRRSVGGTIAACRAALADGRAANLAGGTHHAGPDHGEGFCVFNDVAVAARVMQAEGRVRRVAIVDCDVHQGNGTAAILAGDTSIFTFSIHAEKNFPFRKSASDLDIGLEAGTGDAEYLASWRRRCGGCWPRPGRTW